MPIGAARPAEAVLPGGIGDHGGDWIRFIKASSLNSGSTVPIGGAGRAERYRQLIGAGSLSTRRVSLLCELP